MHNARPRIARPRAWRDKAAIVTGAQALSAASDAVTTASRAPAVGEEELLRAGYYRLLAALLSAPPDHRLLGRLAGVAAAADGFGQTLGLLARAALATAPEKAAGEFQDLFIGLSGGELVPYGSYYLSGFLHERPLARLRADLRALGLARPDTVKEPEDGIASLCEIMAALIEGLAGAPASIDSQRKFFEAHLAPWAGRFFADLEKAERADFYRAVGTLGRRFIEIESEAFILPA